MRNLRHLATTIAQQKLTYEFPYSSFELETDLSFILLSEGKAIVPVSLLCLRVARVLLLTCLPSGRVCRLCQALTIGRCSSCTKRSQAQRVPSVPRDVQARRVCDPARDVGGQSRRQSVFEVLSTNIKLSCRLFKPTLLTDDRSLSQERE